MKKSELRKLIKEEIDVIKPIEEVNLSRSASQLKKEIMEAWTFLRKNNNTIPSDTLDFIRDASLEKLDLLSKYGGF
jgi:hypothetical protein|tara:strand:+ start:1675 stop:1902 length:228 start_codon:yes stop_codon:yes gene_type:complete